jgi:large subunit ribosomal protein L1
MAQHGKKYSDAQRRFDRERVHSPAEAIDLVKSLAARKFDETVRWRPTRRGPAQGRW